MASDAQKAIRSALLTANATGTQPAPPRAKPSVNEPEPLFDYSRLSEVPKVPQVDLPRYEPARGVPERVADLLKKRNVKHKMLETIQSGLEKGGANWYNTDPLRDEFIKRLGPREGDAAHRQYMEYVAATSPRSEVGANARNASYYYHRHMTGQGMPAVGERNPQPYGHMAQRLHQMNAERVSGEGWDPLNNPKPASFVENLAGNQRPVTVDTHAFRLPAIHAQDPRFLETAYQSAKDAPKQNIQKLVESGEMPIKKALSAHWQAQPKANEYGAMERYYQGLAKELGITPAQAQAAAWVGGGKLTGLASDESKPFLRFLQDRVYKTAEETGKDPKDVMDDFIRGKAPLRAAGGVVDQALNVTRKLNPQGLYSQGAETAAALPQAKGTLQQMTSALQNKGVKPAELQGVQVPAYQSAQRAGPGDIVSREDLARYLRHSLPKVHETELSEDRAYDSDPEAANSSPRYGEYTVPSGQNYRELLMHAPPSREPGNNFKSSHWGQPNVLAHLRMSDRYDPTASNGDKMLHLEELQSDWGQAARERGFKHPNFKQDVQDKAVQEYEALRPAAEGGDAAARARMNEIGMSLDAAKVAQRDAVPHHPYVANTNAWVDLGLKRALREAALHGRTRMAWTPGAEQADRYGLHKKVNAVHYDPEGGHFTATLHNGKRGIFESGVTPEGLEKHVGKEVAHKLLAQPRKERLGADVHSLEGLDLRTGGEGMKGFYDKLVPTRLKEVLKKLGHEAKFEPVTITHQPRYDHTGPIEPSDLRTTLHSVHLPEELREKILKEGMPAFKDGGKITLRAAGVILKDPEDRVLFVKRAAKAGDHGGEWAFPGGKIEAGETPAQAAARETHEEIGHEIEGSLGKPVDHAVSPTGVAFTTFEHKVPKSFVPKLNEEHTEHVWAHPNSLPKPLHPGAKATLHRLHGGDVVGRALRITAHPAKTYAAGGSAKGPDYDTFQDGPFYRVARRDLAAQPGTVRQVQPEVRGPGAGADAGGAGPLGDGATQSPAETRLAQLQQIADRHAGHPVVDAGNSESSLHKQSAIGRAFQLAATDHPGYKADVFDAYLRHHPDLVRQSGARNYDELRAAAYGQLGKEVKRQFDELPLKMSFHKNGEGDYPDSKAMRHDVLHNGHLAVYQGGHRHDFLHHVDPKTGLSENEMFRAIHDAYGHALHGSGFGAKGEERAWNAHQQMFSPLAALAMSAETRGQNSFVNYTPINAQLTADKHETEAQIARARRFKDAELEKELLERKKATMANWQYAPQKAVLLPPEMISPQYEGGMPDYVQKHIQPAPSTGLSSPITHFSHSADVSELDPARYGTGIPGDERARVMKRPGGVKERAYGYLGTPDQVNAEPGLGPHTFTGQAHGLYDLAADPIGLGTLATESNRRSPLGNFNPGVVNQAQSMNDLERMAKEHGYSGVANPKAAYPMAALFNKTPVQPAPFAAGGRTKRDASDVSFIPDLQNREIRAVAPNGKEIGYLTMERYGDAAKNNEVFNMAVKPAWQRKGLMRRMHEEAEKHFGILNPSRTLSDDGFAFWKHWRPDAVRSSYRFYKDAFLGQPATTTSGKHGTINSVSDRTMIAQYPEGTTGMVDPAYAQNLYAQARNAEANKTPVQPAAQDDSVQKALRLTAPQP